MSSNVEEIELLNEMWRKFKKENSKPWVNIFPVLRITNVITQTILMDLEDSSYCVDDYLAFLEQIISSDSYNTGDLMHILEKCPSDSKVWTILLTKLESGFTMSNDLVVFVLKHNQRFYEEKHLQALQETGKLYKKDFACTLQNSDEILCHKCSINYMYDDHKIEKYKWLFLAIASESSLFKLSFSILNAFLKECNYSVLSVKVVSIFSCCVKKRNLDSCIEFFPCYYYEIVNLLNEQPCTHCNPLFSSLKDINSFTNEIESILLKSTKGKDELSTILCIYSEWLPFLKSLPIVRTLFVISY